ncbi:MAG TPA: hypothetical protein VGN52_23700 [Burkholderiales bacterium]
MNAIKLFTAAAILTAASSAFAGTDDGNVGPAWQLMPTVPTQTTATRQAPVSAPAPTAAAATADKALERNSAQESFLRQLRESSDGSSDE